MIALIPNPRIIEIAPNKLIIPFPVGRTFGSVRSGIKDTAALRKNAIDKLNHITTAIKPTKTATPRELEIKPITEKATIADETPIIM